MRAALRTMIVAGILGLGASQAQAQGYYSGGYYYPAPAQTYPAAPTYYYSPGTYYYRTPAPRYYRGYSYAPGRYYGGSGSPYGGPAFYSGGQHSLHARGWGISQHGRR